MRQFIVRGFAGAKHPRGVKYGMLLVETTHTSVGSAQVECLAWEERIKRREVAFYDLIDCRPGGTLTQLQTTKANFG